MYEETKSSIDWKGIFLKVIIAFLVVLIAVKGYTTLKGDNNTKKTTTETISESKSSSTFTENIEKLKTAGEKYFTDNKDKLPKNENSTTMVTLNELIKSGNIDSLSDADGKNCDGESSYVTAMLEGTKTKIKANLVCGGASSYSLVYMGENDSVVSETKTSSSTSNSTSNNTKSSATANKCNSSSCSTPNVNVNTETNIDQKITLNGTSKNSSNNSSSKNNNKTKYTVSFDSNGSSDTYSSQKVAENDTATNPGSPYRRGYTFKYWKLNGNRYYFNEPVNRNITLVAYYVKNDSNYNHNYNYDYDYDDDYNRRNRLVEDSYQTFVYTMGWDTKGTDYISIDHTLKVPYEVQEYDPVNVKIASISFSRSMKNQDDMSNYYGNHSNTFFYTKNRWDSNNRSVNSLGYIVSRDVSFSYDRGYKYIDDALSNGFDVNWTANNINKQCRNTISVNGVDNICQYGIIYSIKWTYQYYR